MRNSKSDLVAFVAGKALFEEREARAAVDAVLEGIEHLTANGERLTIRGFGTFALHTRKASVTTNPRTGKQMDVRSTTRLKFRQAKSA